MGTAKRERQKANRQIRLEELAKQARQQKSKRVGVRVAIVLAVVVAIVAAVNLLGGDDEATTPATTVESTVPTCVPADSSTFEPIAAPEQPTVTLPTELPTELQVTTLTEGSGRAAQACDTVRVYYVGVLSADGTQFDSAYERGAAFDVVLGQGQVIAGWDQGLIGVQAGGRYQLDIPAELAYADRGSGDVIKPGDAITFVIDVMAVVPPGSATTGSTVPTTGSSVPATSGSTTPATSAAPTTT